MIPVLLLFALMQQPSGLCDGGCMNKESFVQQPGFEVEPIHKLCDDGKYYLRVTPGTPPVYEEAPCLVTPTSATITIVSPPEPIDVPAIDVCKVSVEGWQVCPMDSCWTGKSVENWIKCSGYKKGCADKTRILQHDEQTPAKYWCHRVQP